MRIKHNDGFTTAANVRINYKERALWVDNDEGLYRWWKLSGKSKRQFIKENRAGIDTVIRAVLKGVVPAHYLMYRGGAK